MGNRSDLDADRRNSDPIRILSLDGGGMRGVIPASILVELERLSGRPVAALFDVIAGTSTGGMIALAGSKPGEGGGPGVTAEPGLGNDIQASPNGVSPVELPSLR